MSELKNLRTFCDEYYKKTNLKIHPSAVPVDVVLDDLMGKINSLFMSSIAINEKLNNINDRFSALEHSPTVTKPTKKKVKNE